MYYMTDNNIDKTPQNAQEQIRQDYLSGHFSVDELSQIYNTDTDTILTYLSNTLTDKDRQLYKIDSSDSSDSLDDSDNSEGLDSLDSLEGLGSLDNSDSSGSLGSLGNGGEGALVAHKPPRNKLAAELEKAGVTEELVAAKMAKLLQKEQPATVLRVIEAYLKIMGYADVGRKMTKIAKMAQIINLPDNNRQQGDK